MGLEIPLWRALSVFRVAVLGYSIILMIASYGRYDWAVLGWLVLAGMGLWTGLVGVAYADPARRRWPLLIADLAVAVGCLLASGWVIPQSMLAAGAPTLPTAWVAGPVLAWALTVGSRWAAVAALIIGVADYAVRGTFAQTTINGTALLLLAGGVTGYMVQLIVQSEQRLQRAIELEAATRERERLARDIHDSVLQVLALVQRRGTELGGEAAELGRLAGEQETTLRTLVGRTWQDPYGGGLVDVRAPLSGLAGPEVTISAPATPVWLPAHAAAEVCAAAGCAVDNTAVHCPPGTKTWILVEDEPEQVMITIRDDGPGFVPSRLAEAEASGRLGVAQSIRGRLRDLGGTAVITSAPGKGTEVELRLPRGAGTPT